MQPVSWIKTRVNPRIFPLISFGGGGSLSPCAKASFEGVLCPNGCTGGRTLAKDIVECQKMDRATRMFISSTSSFVLHIGFVVSLKLCLNL